MRVTIYMFSYGKIWVIIPKLSLLLLLIWSTGSFSLFPVSDSQTIQRIMQLHYMVLLHSFMMGFAKNSPDWRDLVLLVDVSHSPSEHMTISCVCHLPLPAKSDHPVNIICTNYLKENGYSKGKQNCHFHFCLPS